jgi:prepilin-type N-terminal cleavage/methylation domain-containing protein
MKTPVESKRDDGLTLVEVLVVIAIVAVLVIAFLIPRLAGHRRSQRIECVNNLKQVGLAARVWSYDHNERFPWSVSTNAGGTKEFASSSEVFRHFAVLSNGLVGGLSGSKFLVCPSDAKRHPAKDFENLANGNVSYFIGLDADEKHPNRILNGDPNLIGGTTNGYLLVYSPNSNPGWDTSLHHLSGNVSLSDGSVQQFTSESLAHQVQAAFATMTNAEMRLAVPRVPGE